MAEDTTELKNLRLAFPCYVLNEPVSDDRTHTPCGMMLDPVGGKVYALLFTTQHAAAQYVKRAQAQGTVKPVGEYELASIAKKLMLQQQAVEHFMVDATGDEGEKILLHVHDAARLGLE